jgi:hypothetical protein
MRQEREACCDDIAIGMIDGKKNYLDALVNFQEYSLLTNRYVLGMSNKKQFLFDRVKRIVTCRNQSLNLLEKSLIAGGLVLFSAFTMIGSTNEKKPVVVMESKEKPLQPPLLIESKTARTFVNTTREQPKIKRRTPVATGTPIAKDTIPAVKKNMLLTDPALKKAAPVEKEGNKAAKASDPDKVLKEIIALKEEIGVKKESIGKKKEQLTLKQGKNDPEEIALKKAIDIERKEVEGKRDELNIKRKELEILKKDSEHNKKKIGADDNKRFAIGRVPTDKPRIGRKNEPSFKKDQIQIVKKPGAFELKTEAKIDLKNQKTIQTDMSFEKQELPYKMANPVKPAIKSPPQPQALKAPPVLKKEPQ